LTIYAFYAMQPYLLELCGMQQAYAIAGPAAAIVAGAQIAGGLLVPQLGRIFRRRTGMLLAGTALATLTLAGIGLVPRFGVAISLLVSYVVGACLQALSLPFILLARRQRAAADVMSNDRNSSSG
jgi:cyanate permease